jgi:predicted RNA binding protein YcfA (HicA-like mRNA interferase family)
MTGERLRRMTAREVEGLLRQHGFELVSQKGQPSQVAASGSRLAGYRS